MARLLYFPHINVMDTPWLRQALLFWEGVSSIVPLEFWDRPELLDENMQFFLKEEIVTQVHPAQYIYKIQGFEERFKKHLELNPRTALTSKEWWKRVHFEKLGGIKEILLEKQLAFKDSNNDFGSWLLVEPNTADEFMTYLAVSMAGTTNRMIAMTDDRRNFSSFFSGNFSLQEKYELVIEALLPSPGAGIELRDIINFREQHCDKLWSFRKEVERGIRDANSRPIEFRQKILNAKIADWRDEAVSIADKMRQSGWSNLGWGSLAGLGSAAVGATGLANGNVNEATVAGGLGFFAATSSMIKEINGELEVGPLAYASQAWNRFE